MIKNKAIRKLEIEGSQPETATSETLQATPPQHWDTHARSPERGVQMLSPESL